MSRIAMDSYLSLIQALFTDLAESYPSFDREFARDFALIQRRVKCEGLSFLTKTLPAFGKAIDKALSAGTCLVTPHFRKYGATGLPAFMRAPLRLVFDLSGNPRPDLDPRMVAVLRQVTYLFYKLEVPYEEATVQAKIDSFIDVDSSLPLNFDHLPSMSRRILDFGQELISRTLKDFDVTRMRPKHGSGAVAGREKNWEKGRTPIFVKQIASAFPYEEYFFLSYTHLCDELPCFLDALEKDYLLSRMESVPKDSRGPRLIGLEPREYMYVQQAIKDELYCYLESHAPTRGHVNFSSQDINRNLALSSSIDRHFSTLDMKDASDRVSLALVKHLFKRTELLPFLLASRTPGIVLPDGRVLFYKKFAPMGSAVTFPIEALIFWSLAVSTLHVEMGMPLNLALSSVYVYGDDIIVPTHCASGLLSRFPDFSLLFNEAKCAITGPFRESCGMDAIGGFDVTPVRIKALLPHGKLKTYRNAPSDLVSSIEYSNEFFEKGYKNVALFLLSLVEAILGPLPSSIDTEPSALMSRVKGNTRSGLPLRWNKDLQRFEVLTWAVCPKKIEVDSDSWCFLFSSILLGGKEEGPGVFSVPYRTSLRRAWRVLPSKRRFLVQA